jgi:hypothetical protein
MRRRLPPALAALALALIPLLPPDAARAEATPRGASTTRPAAAMPMPEVSLLAPPPLPAAPRSGPAPRSASRRPARPPVAPPEPEAVAYTTDPSFRLANRSGLEVQQIYVSPATDRSWGRDRLGQDVLRPGRFTTILLPDGQCVNDLRVVFADGQAVERRGVNTCALSDLAVP